MIMILKKQEKDLIFFNKIGAESTLFNCKFNQGEFSANF